MDVRQGDRLTVEGALYEVTLVHADREVETVCSLEVRQ
jgi:hypothetical protein